MRPRARISVWAVVIPVAVLVIAYIVFALITHRASIPSSLPSPQPTATPRPAPTAAEAPSQSVTGTWAGTLGQNGGPFDTYTFSMNLVEAANGAVSGTARAEVANRSTFYVVESVTGQVTQRVFTFQKGNVLESNPPGQAWCIDRGQLTLSPDGSTLNGTWTDEGCGSGPVTLTRQS